MKPRCAAGASHLVLVCLLLSGALEAGTIDETNRYGWSANTGWVDFGTPEGNVVIGEYVCSGYSYSPNLGWIFLGDGTPANGIRYSNTDSSDCGVNRTDNGNLRGLAYGANIGWISFEETGNPRVDLTSGQFSGSAYSANTGWIQLGDATRFIKTLTIIGGADSDDDGISDSWELEQTGTLNVLGSNQDADGDGIDDVDEYQADTSPTNSSDGFKVQQAGSPDDPSGFFSIQFKSSSNRIYRILVSDDLDEWSDSGLGTFAGESDGETTKSINVSGATRKFFRVESFLPGDEAVAP